MEYAKICDIGKVRKINQDSVFAAARQDAGLFVVADGMGGYSRGEKASQHIVGKMAEWWEGFCPPRYGEDFKRMELSLERMAEQANREIYENYNKADICGSTMVILFIYKEDYAILFAGDSRAYMCRGWKFRQLTVDEVWENRPGLKPGERRDRWEQCHGKLYNAIGVRGTMQCSMLTNAVKPGTVFLLCSDGLYKYCSRQHVKKCMIRAGRADSLKKSAALLLDLVYEGEAGDNISAILVRV